MSEYVRHLREAVGPRLLLMPAVVTLPRDDDERLLLVRHSDTKLWGCIGGAVDPGEAPSAAAVRECREETGLELELGCILGAVGGPGYEVTYGNGDRVGYVATVYDARVVSGDLRPDGEEVDQAEWFSRDEIDRLELGSFCSQLFAELRIGHRDAVGPA